MTDISTTQPERYIRLTDGSIYGYTDLLAKRRDASVVDGYVAAQWFKSQGIENELTARYPDVIVPDSMRPVPPAPRVIKPNRNEEKRELDERVALKRTERADKLRRLKAETAPKDDNEPSLFSHLVE